MRPTLGLLTTFFLTLLACSTDSEESPFDWENNGIKIEKDRVIAYFPRDSVDEMRMNEIVDSLNIGINSALRYIDGPYEWQVFHSKPINYYFEPGEFVSITDVNGDIYIPLGRIKHFQAPWLHETMHALLRTKKGNWNKLSRVRRFLSMPIWFTEGMAEYLAVKIEATDSIAKFDLMKFGGYQKADSSCRTALALHPNLASQIGESGIPLKLLTDRRAFAPPFYTCSCSFVKFLAERYGLDKMIQANTEFQNEEETIEDMTGKTMGVLRDEWISYLDSSEFVE